MPSPLIINPLERTDSYKQTHPVLLPPDTQFVYSYLTSRGGMFPRVLWNGLQYYTLGYLAGKFFDISDIEPARQHMKAHFGRDDCFQTAGWTNMFHKHGGRLPIRIKALPEGEVVESHNALMTVENTDPEFPWLTNWIETLLMKVWYPTTVGTLSREIRQVIGKALVRTGTPSLLNYKLHDFGYRGVSSEETAAIGGAAHLINFRGTDTLAATALARQYYDIYMAGNSIPASEHSVICAWGKEFENEAYANFLRRYPDGMIACVSDTYDIHNAVANLWMGKLRDEVMGRNGVLVIRPDSGDMIPVMEDIFETVGEKAGWESNSKGYRVMPSCVRAIQGDGVNFFTIQNMISQLTRKGWSMDNWGFGMGGALLQQLNRDTLRFAFKASAIDRAGVWFDIYKDPKTDPSKASRPGRFVVVNNGGGFVTLPYNENVIVTSDRLQTVFENGEVKRIQNFEDIRTRAEKYDDFEKVA